MGPPGWVAALQIKPTVCSLCHPHDTPIPGRARRQGPLCPFTSLGKFKQGRLGHVGTSRKPTPLPQEAHPGKDACALRKESERLRAWLEKPNWICPREALCQRYDASLLQMQSLASGP